MRSTWRNRIALLAVAVALVAGGCSHKKSDAKKGPAVSALPTEAKKLKTVQPGKLVACTAATDPPFFFDDGGRPSGVDAELVRALGGRLGLAGDFVPVPAAQAIDNLKAGKCDIAVAGIVITDTLKQQVDLSAPYLPTAPAVVTKKADAATFKTASALQGKAVAVVADSPAAADIERAAKANGFTMTPYPDYDKALAAVKAGQIVAVVGDLPTLAYKVKDSADVAVASVIRDQQTGGYGIATRKGEDDLTKQVGSALTQVKADDTFRMVLAPYFGDATNLVVG
jgi:polar amino acid transport system substrate-binding protein